MSAGRGEVVARAFVRRAGVEHGPALWLVPALGDSSDSFVPLFATGLGAVFDLYAPDLPGAGATLAEPAIGDLDALADWLARTIERCSPNGSVALVGHSLGAAVAVRAAHRLGARVVGVFSIEGNLTEADAYFSGAAAGFEDPEMYKEDLIRRVRALEEQAVPGARQALWRYLVSLTVASAEAIWRIARSAKAASAGDGLGAEYRRLAVPSLYYWSPQNTPMSEETIYLDYNATTPLLPEVVDAMLPYLRDHFGNPSSAHARGRAAREAVESARARVAGLLGCDADEIVFTSGGTESINLAICGVAEARADRRHVVTTVLEHPAVAAPCAWLEGRGWRVTRAGVDGEGRVRLAEVAGAVGPDTVLVTVSGAQRARHGTAAQHTERPLPARVGDDALGGGPRGGFFHRVGLPHGPGRSPVRDRRDGCRSPRSAGHRPPDARSPDHARGDRTRVRRARSGLADTPPRLAAWPGRLG